MVQDREAHENILRELLTQRGYALKRVPSEHAGGKWRLGYRSFAGILQNIELDLNYMHRVPLLPVQLCDSFPLGEQLVRAIPVLDIHELAAGKLCALIARCKPRDLFDACNLLNHPELDREKLRCCFVVYAAFNKVDFSIIDGLGELKFDTQLLPGARHRYSARSSISQPECSSCGESPETSPCVSSQRR